MPFEMSKRKYWQIPVKHELNLVVKSMPVDLTGVYYHFGQLYDGGKLVHGTFAHQSDEKAKEEIVEWAKENYKINGKIRQGRSVPI